MLSVRGLESGYGRARVLFGVSLDVEPGQLVCVMGRNGVGKTTLLNTIMGVIPATAGTVTFEGRDVTRLKPHERVRPAWATCRRATRPSRSSACSATCW